MVEPFSATEPKKNFNSIYCFKPSSFFIWFRSLPLHTVLHFNASSFSLSREYGCGSRERASLGFHCSTDFSPSAAEERGAKSGLREIGNCFLMPKTRKLLIPKKINAAASLQKFIIICSPVVYVCIENL